MSEATTFCEARRDDLAAIVDLLADDPLGKTRERVGGELADAYVQAFEAIQRDPHQRLLVGRCEGRVVAVLQLSLIPGISRGGALRAQIEGVRVAASHRSGGLGEELIRHAIDQARSAGARLVQLTSDKSRADAIRFYERLGFRATHEGMKLELGPGP